MDAVLSEDVDTLMFGSGVTMRNWSAEGAKYKTPTHVTVYERAGVERESGLTPNGMILVALMRGGDYLPEGVPKCGIKTAVEVAKAGFGEQLCALSVDDGAGLGEWRRRLQRELETNENGFFKRKNKSIRIPDGFPDKTVLGHYTNPVVSSPEKVERLKEKICWSGKIDTAGLRESARWAFEWRGKLGAAKFIRCLAPAVLSWNLCSATEDVREIVLGFHGQREHSSTGECKELRISFVPGSVVVVNMVAEVDDEVDAEPDEDDEFAPGADEGVRKGKDYDPSAVERMWVLEVFARQGVPDMVEEYQNLVPKTKKKPTTTKKLRQRVKEKEADNVGAMLERLDISNPDSQNIGLSGARIRGSGGIARGASVVDITTLAERLDERLVLEDHPEEPPFPLPRIQDSSVPLGSEPKAQKKPKTPKARSRRTRRPEEVQEGTSIQTTTPRPSETLGQSPPRGRRYSSLGIHGGPPSPQRDAPLSPPPIDFTLKSPTRVPPTPTPLETISIPSSPEASLYPPPPSPPSRRRRPPLTPLRGPGRQTPKKAVPPICLVVDISDPESTSEPPVPQILNTSITAPRGTPHGSQFPLSLPVLTPPPPPIFPILEEEQEVSVVKGRTTKKVVLRESLEGCWEFADDARGRDKSGWEQVEVVDLTEN